MIHSRRGRWVSIMKDEGGGGILYSDIFLGGVD